MTSTSLQRVLKKAGTPERAKISARFFKTGPGQYGEGDIFLGVTMPEARKIAKSFCGMPLREVQRSMKSKCHEERIVALLILIQQFEAGDVAMKNRIYDFYLKHTKYINNWDLVDISAHKIVGPWLEDKSRMILTKLAKSKSLWERRIAMLSTFHFIMKGESKDALRIAAILVNDDQDLIQKAVGWMLREVGKRCSMKEEEAFLKRYYRTMPRTMLRYAIERFPEKKRKAYLYGKR